MEKLKESVDLSIEELSKKLNDIKSRTKKWKTFEKNLEKNM